MEIRWKQRLQNFSRGVTLLSDALSQGTERLSALEQEGVVQRFEYTFELAWKTLKDFLEESGLTVIPLTPRQVLKDAFAAKLISDGQTWLDMLAERNLLAHTYDEQVFTKAVRTIHTRYLPAIIELRDWLAKQP
ncbi:MAG: nucleotidyltransferase substrate binding protein [Opitutaceae bacterium]|nr:nucleotidyltransferase substrate binding protein [Opitutaceae bacterium]